MFLVTMILALALLTVGPPVAVLARNNVRTRRK